MSKRVLAETGARQGTHVRLLESVAGDEEVEERRREREEQVSKKQEERQDERRTASDARSQIRSEQSDSGRVLSSDSLARDTGGEA